MIRKRELRTLTCPRCGQEFTTSFKTATWCSKRCASAHRAGLDPAKRAAQIAIARACRKPPRPKPDVTVFDVPVFRAPPRPAVEEPAPLPPVPMMDHASRVMLGWAGARI